MGQMMLAKTGILARAQVIKWLVVIFAVLLVSWLGLSYVVPQVRFHVELQKPEDVETLSDAIDAFLVARGFQILHREGLVDYTSPDVERERGWTQFYAKYLGGLSVRLIDFSDVEFKLEKRKPFVSEMPITDNPVLEVVISEFRPGGFSEAGLDFYEDLTTFIQDQRNEAITIIQLPRANDQFEYVRVRVLTWVYWFTIAMSLLGFILFRALKSIRMNLVAKRAIFVLIGVALATPLPILATPVSTILPSLFVLPWLGTAYFQHAADYAIPSVAASLFITTVLSFVIFRDRSAHGSPA